MLGRVLTAACKAIGLILFLLPRPPRLRAVSDPRLVFYHGVGDGRSPCFKYLSDEIPLDCFRKQITYLQNSYRLVSLDQATSRKPSDEDNSSVPLCNISFDDGLHTVYSEVFPLFRERGIPATVFLSTSVIGNRGLLWLHLLNYLLATFSCDSVSRWINSRKPSGTSDTPSDHKGLERWCRKYYKFIHEGGLMADLCEHYHVDPKAVAEAEKLYLNWDEIEEMSHHGFMFCSHSSSHAPLGTLSGTESLRSEIADSYACLKAQHWGDLRFVSVPFGMESDYGSEAIGLALSEGHDYVVEVGDGVNLPDRPKRDRILSRVGLGGVTGEAHALYAAIEVVPYLKSKIRAALNRA